ncbi:MAG: hypothetical protein LBK95_05700 [Bifidobacteriaceae bacterium]|nr:hypothetical protein [Bifidobacteriaceae bacterium]
MAQELSPLAMGLGSDPAQRKEAGETISLMQMAGMFTAARHLTVEDMDSAIAEGARESAGL